MNAVTLTGYISQDAQGRKSSSGPYAVIFTLAVNDRIRTKRGEVDRPMFFECIRIGHDARELEPMLRRGTMVAVRGDFIQDDAVTSKIVRVDAVEVLDVAR